MRRSEEAVSYRNHEFFLQKGGMSEDHGSRFTSSRGTTGVTLGILGLVNQLVLQEDPDFGNHNQILETFPPRDHGPTASAPLIYHQNNGDICFNSLSSSSSSSSSPPSTDYDTITDTVLHPRLIRPCEEGIFVVPEISVLDREAMLLDLCKSNIFSPNDLVELLLGENYHSKKREGARCDTPTNYKMSSYYGNDDCITNHNFVQQGARENVSKNVTSWYPPCRSSSGKNIINNDGTTSFGHTTHNAATDEAIIIDNSTSRNKHKRRKMSCDKDDSTSISSANMMFSNKKRKIHNFIDKNTNYSTFFNDGDEEDVSAEDFEPFSIWNEDEEQQTPNMHTSDTATVFSAFPTRGAVTPFVTQFEGTKNEIATCSGFSGSTSTVSNNCQNKVENYKKMNKHHPNENVFQEDTKEKSCSNKKTFDDRTISNDKIAVASSDTTDDIRNTDIVNKTNLAGNIASSRTENTTGIAAISATIKDCCQITTPCGTRDVVVRKSDPENDLFAAKVENGDTRCCDGNQHVTTVSKNPSKTASSLPCDKQQHFRDYQCEMWTLRFQELLDYKKEHGDCNVPNIFPQNRYLAQWVKRQRYQYKLKLEGKSSTVTNERQDILEKAGFIWDAHEASWMERWNELKAFREEHGNCHVPTNYSQNQRLAIWAKCQRRQRKLYISGKPSNMNPERLSLLESLGFDWDPRKSRNEQVTKNTTPSP